MRGVRGHKLTPQFTPQYTKDLQDSNGQVHHFLAHKSPENMGLLGIKANKR